MPMPWLSLRQLPLVQDVQDVQDVQGAQDAQDAQDSGCPAITS
jgi:hypothetical protein